MRLVNIRRIILAIGFELDVTASGGNSEKCDAQQASLLCRRKNTPAVGVCL